MTIDKLIESEPAVFSNREAQHRPILLMSRIRLARNLEAFAFPGWASNEDRMTVYEMCRSAIEKIPQFNPCCHLSVESIDQMERQFLVERHLISRELTEGKKGSGVTINDAQSASIMINEEDHLRIQVMSPEVGFEGLWKRSDAIDNELEKHLDFAFRSHFGFLTACPTNLGTGMRASAMMHLPALVFTKQMEKVVRAVNQLGIVARGIFGESSDPSGSVFQISNQQTLGESEMEIIQRLSHVIATIIEQENNARIRLFETDSNRIMDRILRAYGVLKYCKMITSNEAMNLLSGLRLASDIGMLDGSFRRKVDKLIMDIQPAHLQQMHGSPMDTEMRDVVRAEKIRDAIGDIEEPDPSKLQFTDFKETIPIEKLAPPERGTTTSDLE